MKTAVQKVQLIGKVGESPRSEEYGLTDNMIRFCFGVSEKYTDQQGKSVSYTIWHNVIVAGPLAHEHKKLRKGNLIRLSGKMLQSSWIDRKGTYRTSTKIRATHLAVIHS